MSLLVVKRSGRFNCWKDVLLINYVLAYVCKNQVTFVYLSKCLIVISLVDIIKSVAANILYFTSILEKKIKRKV